MMDRPAGAVINPADEPARPELSPPVALDDAWHLLLSLRRQVDDGTSGPCGEPWGFRQAGEPWNRAHGRLAEIWLDPATGHLRRAARPLSAAARLLLDLHGQHAVCRRGATHVIAML